MNPGENVSYQQKPCVVLDAGLEGCSLDEGLLLLEDVTHYSRYRGRIRHFASFDSVGQMSRGQSPNDPSA